MDINRDKKKSNNTVKSSDPSEPTEIAEPGSDNPNPTKQCPKTGQQQHLVTNVDDKYCLSPKPKPSSGIHFCYRDLVGNCEGCGEQPPTYSWRTVEEMCRVQENHAAM